MRNYIKLVIAALFSAFIINTANAVQVSCHEWNTVITQDKVLGDETGALLAKASKHKYELLSQCEAKVKSISLKEIVISAWRSGELVGCTHIAFNDKGVIITRFENTDEIPSPLVKYIWDKPRSEER